MGKKKSKKFKIVSNCVDTFKKKFNLIESKVVLIDVLTYGTNYITKWESENGINQLKTSDQYFKVPTKSVVKRKMKNNNMKNFATYCDQESSDDSFNNMNSGKKRSYQYRKKKFNRIKILSDSNSSLISNSSDEIIIRPKRTVHILSDSEESNSVDDQNQNIKKKKRKCTLENFLKNASCNVITTKRRSQNRTLPNPDSVKLTETPRKKDKKIKQEPKNFKRTPLTSRQLLRPLQQNIENPTDLKMNANNYKKNSVLEKPSKFLLKNFISDKLDKRQKKKKITLSKDKQMKYSEIKNQNNIDTCAKDSAKNQMKHKSSIKEKCNNIKKPVSEVAFSNSNITNDEVFVPKTTTTSEIEEIGDERYERITQLNSSHLDNFKNITIIEEVNISEFSNTDEVETEHIINENLILKHSTSLEELSTDHSDDICLTPLKTNKLYSTIKKVKLNRSAHIGSKQFKKKLFKYNVNNEIPLLSSNHSIFQNSKLSNGFIDYNSKIIESHLNTDQSCIGNERNFENKDKNFNKEFIDNINKTEKGCLLNNENNQCNKKCSYMELYRSDSESNETNDSSQKILFPRKESEKANNEIVHKPMFDSLSKTNKHIFNFTNIKSSIKRPPIKLVGEVKGKNNFNSAKNNMLSNEDAISLFAESIAFNNINHVSDDSSISESNDLEFNYNETLNKINTLNDSNSPVTKWLEKQSSNIENNKIDSDTVSSISPENLPENNEPNALQYLCPNIKRIGKCDVRNTCRFMHSLILSIESEINLIPWKIIVEEYQNSITQKYEFLYFTLFPILAKHYGESKDFNKLSELVTDILLFDTKMDKSYNIIKIIDNICASEISPQSAIEIIFRKAEVPKDTMSNFTDMLIGIVLESYNLEESWAIILMLIKSKKYDIDCNFVEDMLSICTKQNNPNQDLCRRVYKDIIENMDESKLQSINIDMIKSVEKIGLKDIALKILEKRNKIHFSTSLSVVQVIKYSSLSDFHIPKVPIFQQSMHQDIKMYHTSKMNIDSSLAQHNTEALKFQPTHPLPVLLNPCEICAAMDAENFTQLIQYAKKYDKHKLLNDFYQICVKFLESSSKNWTTYFYNMHHEFMKNKENLLINVFTTLAVNVIIILNRMKQWRYAYRILNILNLPDLRYVEVFTMEKYSMNHKLLLIFSIFLKVNKFSEAWNFALDEKLVQNTNSWNIIPTQDEITLRNQLCDELFTKALKSKSKFSLVIFSRILEWNIRDIDIKKFINEYIIKAINADYRIETFNLIRKKINDWHEHVEKKTFRAVVILFVRAGNFKSLFLYLYKIGAHKNIYPYFNGLEEKIFLSIGYLEEEIFFLMDCLLNIVVKNQPVKSLQICLIIDNSAQSFSLHIPKMLAVDNLDVNIAKSRLLNVLTNRIRPPLHINVLSKSDIMIQLNNNYMI